MRLNTTVLKIKYNAKFEYYGKIKEMQKKYDILIEGKGHFFGFIKQYDDVYSLDFCNMSDFLSIKLIQQVNEIAKNFRVIATIRKDNHTSVKLAKMFDFKIINQSQDFYLLTNYD